ncbi:MAG TPA: 4-carboxymuconolactone decarboxylase [Alphaproteobacteria bacterium]
MSLIQQLFERGMAIRTEVLGRAHVERARSRTTPFTEDFQTYITQYVWGDVWNRPGLDRKTRSMLTIAMLAALGREDELKLHIRATRNTGVTRDEVKEILLQVGVYAGVPAANTAFRLAQEIFEEIDRENGR